MNTQCLYGILLMLAVLAGCAEPNLRARKGELPDAARGKADGGDVRAATAGPAMPVSGAAGGTIGTYMDRQEAVLRTELAGIGGASVRRDQDVLALTFAADLMFDSNSAALKAGGFDVLGRVARVLSQYQQTALTVAGHSDSSGRAEYNRKLSEQRAQAVKDALVSLGVAGSRITAAGFGATQPLGDNSTDAGRTLNRRVNMYISPAVKLP